MLKQRIITGSILVLIVIGSLYLLPTIWFSALFGVFLLLGAWEWARFCGYSKSEQRYFYVLVVLTVGVAAMLLAHKNPAVLKFLLIVACAWWVMALVDIIGGKQGTPLFSFPVIKLISGIIVLVATWLSVYSLHMYDNNSPSALLFLFIVVWLADSGAYLAGKTWGRIKLAPSVSPGKTVEGLLGGLVAVAVFAFLVGYFYAKFPAPVLLTVLIVSVVTALFSVLGDLAESKYKRLAGIKDSGNILPGHGGIMDRIDGFAAAAPVFALCWVSLLNKGVV